MFQMKTLKIVFPETTKSRAFIFGMQHHLVHLYHVCSNYTPGLKNGHRGNMFYMVYMEKNMEKSSC